MRTLYEDLRYAFRVLRGSPGFTAVAVITLALGIAANATVFGWIDSLLVRPFPGVAGGGELVELETVSPNGEYSTTSYRDYRDYRDSVKSFSGVAASLFNAFTVGPVAHPRRVFRRIRLRQLLRGAGRKARAWACVPAVGIWRQCGRRAGSGDQLPPLAGPVSGRPRCGRQNHPREPLRTDRGRHRARGIPRHHARHADGDLDSHEHGAHAEWPGRLAAGRAGTRGRCG